MSSSSSSIPEMASAFLATVADRVRKVLTFQGMGEKEWMRMAVVVCTYLLIRPWLLKLGGKVTEQEYENMEARDRERMDRQQAEFRAQQDQAGRVNALRVGPKALANGEEGEDEDAAAAATTANDVEAAAESDSLIQRAKRRAAAAAEVQKMVDDEKRAQLLENWDEDEQFLKNFGATSDRNHAVRS